MFAIDSTASKEFIDKTKEIVKRILNLERKAPVDYILSDINDSGKICMISTWKLQFNSLNR